MERPNRFIALVEQNGETLTCHVKNTGRCRELLTPGAKVWLEQSPNPNRKTAYDLIAVWKPAGLPYRTKADGTGKNSQASGKMPRENPAGPAIWQADDGRMVNMDSQAPNKVVQEWLEQGMEGSIQPTNKPHPFPEITKIQPEYRYGTSRIDFYIEAGYHKPRKILLEVKGVTLEEGGVAKFPDAPTERGIKHMLELEKSIREGYEPYILFLIQMEGICRFEPNGRTHPQFGETLRQVQGAGVQVLAYGCHVTPWEIVLDMPIEVKL